MAVRLIFVAAFSCCIAVYGGIIAWQQAPFAFGLGDNAFFHSIVTWLLKGEMYLRDFVHFRTPGSYYFYEWINRVVGSSFRATSFAILLETFVFQPVASIALAAAASRTILGRISIPLVLACGLSFFFLIPIFQLRTAMPAAAVALYLPSLLPLLPAAGRSALLVLAGLALGLAYWAGMETFLFAAYAIGVAEILHSGRQWRTLLRRCSLLAVPGLVVIALPLAWMATQGLDLGKYAFYTVYYALVVQPSGLNLPFPPLSFRTLQTHYAPFVILAGAVCVFTANRRLTPASVVLLGFATLRMISALGRADALHVAFSISELPLVTVLAILVFFQDGKLVSWRGALAGLATFAVIVVGMTISAMVLVLIPPLLAALAVLEERTAAVESAARRWPLQGSVAALAMLLVLFALQYPDSLGYVQQRLARPPELTEYAYSGTRLTKEGRRELHAAAAFIKDKSITSLFAFPVIPAFYTLVDLHPTSVTYFEGQVQPWEMEQTIVELEREQTQWVVQAFDQVVASSWHLYPLADYLSSAYATVSTIEEGGIIELRERRPRPSFISRLSDRLYDANAGAAFGTARLERLTEGALPVPVIEALQPLQFDYDANAGTVFTAWLLPRDASGSVARADIEIIVGDVPLRQTVTSERPTSIALTPGTPFTLILHPLDTGEPSRWADAQVRE